MLMQEGVIRLNYELPTQDLKYVALSLQSLNLTRIQLPLRAINELHRVQVTRGLLLDEEHAPKGPLPDRLDHLKVFKAHLLLLGCFEAHDL